MVSHITKARPKAEPEATGPGAAVPRSGKATPYLFLAPYLLLFCVFMLAPAITGIWVSLHDWDFLLEGKPFVGLDNYIALFDPASAVYADFWMAMRATGIFTLFSVPFLVVLPLGLALLLNRRFRGRTFFRGLFFAPYVLGVAVVCLMWRLLLDPNLGVVNWILGSQVAWTTSLPAGWVALVGVTVWWTLGFNGVIYLAGLQDIPRELYDAAKVDGANRWAEFRNVTLPGLRPVMLFVVTTTILASANMFGQSYLLTDGAPGGETRTAIMYILDQGLTQYKMGSASAMSYVLTLVLILISVINFRVFRGRS
ncbi:sugar ABC transporter permease [Nonomuraea sp. K274]|uniref:Sugar ABC transporter permease n=1 Tax=Nonomuraea cypriaca TaxID=1187855 RepID=A0A931AE17_9ACTN|nr:sugar ABC transporter permease [Nonomuraea cypriaca]MBF8190198.1 sugar ABC transporter permease [Nonomuraea cypriaca]